MRRRHPIPREVTNALALQPHERVLAGATDVAGRWVVASDRALYLPSADDGPHHRIPWERVERAEWDRDSEVLRVVESAELGERMPVRLLRFEQPDRRLLSLVRERITASVVIDQYVRLRGDRGVRVIARRSPDEGMELVWAVAFDEGLDPRDPEVLAGAERALALVRAEVEQ